MLNIIFKLDKPLNPKSSILMVYRFDKLKLVMSTGILIEPKYWDNDRKVVKKIDNDKDDQHLIFNKLIDKYRWALTTAYDECISQSKPKTLVGLKERVNQLLKKKSSEAVVSDNIPNFIDFLITNLENENESKALCQKYRQLKDNIVKCYGKQVVFYDLNLLKLKEFKSHLSNKVREYTGETYSRNSVNKHLNNLISIINKAKDYGILINEDYKSKSWRVAPSKDSISGNDVYLTVNEIIKLEQAQLSDALDRVRDRFLLGIYTGQRYSDYSKINKDVVVRKNNIDLLEIKQVKGNKLVYIYLDDKIKKILDKYNGYPPTISEQKFNAAIKKICKAIGMTDTINIYTDKANQKNPTFIKKEKWEHVSSHTARRTYCTLKIMEKDTSIYQIMAVTGHSSLSTFSRYVRMNIDANVLDPSIIMKSVLKV
jgi:integrase